MMTTESIWILCSSLKYSFSKSTILPSRFSVTPSLLVHVLWFLTPQTRSSIFLCNLYLLQCCFNFSRLFRSYFLIGKHQIQFFFCVLVFYIHNVIETISLVCTLFPSLVLQIASLLYVLFNCNLILTWCILIFLANHINWWCLVKKKFNSLMNGSSVLIAMFWIYFDNISTYLSRFYLRAVDF